MDMEQLNWLQAWERLWRRDLDWIDAQRPSNWYVFMRYTERRRRVTERICNSVLEQRRVCADAPAPLW